MNSDTSAIAARGLRKSFGTILALDNFDLDVATGEVHGFVGPNGAGKSTTIRALLGQLRVDSGSARVLGRDAWQHAVQIHRRLAYVPGDVALWNTLTGGECIDILLRLQGGGDVSRRKRLIRDFELDPTKRIRTYSKGNRQKVALIAAFARECDLLLLDEPTSGLDPLMEDVFRDWVRQARERETTVLLSSHLLSQVEALCDRITVIRAGRTVCSGTLDQLRAHTSTTIVCLTAQPVAIDPAWMVGGLDIRRSTDGIRTHFRIGHHALAAALGAVHAAGLRDLTVEPPGLEELFRSLYESGEASGQTRLTSTFAGGAR